MVLVVRTAGLEPVRSIEPKTRNLIERLFCRLKNWRRIATRYDRLARNFLSGLALVAVAAEWDKWVPNLVPIWEDLF